MGHESFQLHKNYFCEMLTHDTKHENVPPPLDLNSLEIMP